jgi:acetyl-CoA synthetase
VKATVVTAPEWRDREGEALVKELQNHVKQITAPYKYPRVIEFVHELPKTISGKIRRVEIREQDKKNA